MTAMRASLLLGQTKLDRISISPAKARDLILSSFHDLHRETLASARRRLGSPAEDDETLRAAEGLFKSAFFALGARFEHPDRASLERVSTLLEKKALAWGAPLRDVEKHRQRVDWVLGRTPA